VQTACAPDLPLIWLDFTRIEQVLTNLLENAAKYTPAGTPIAVTAHVAEEWIWVCVQDGGPGIPAADRAGLFAPFAARRVPGRPLGTGLGLSIVRGIVVAHGGQITAAPPPDGGWVVQFTLPLGRPGAGPSAARRLQASPGAADGPARSSLPQPQPES